MQPEIVSRLSAKLGHLEEKHQSLQIRQDAIDNLALDTLFKMELLMTKINAITMQNKQWSPGAATTTEENGGKDINVINFLA